MAGWLIRILSKRFRAKLLALPPAFHRKVAHERPAAFWAGPSFHDPANLLVDLIHLAAVAGRAFFRVFTDSRSAKAPVLNAFFHSCFFFACASVYSPIGNHLSRSIFNPAGPLIDCNSAKEK